MSRQDREAWEVRLQADPALREAWDAFRDLLARVTGPLLPAQRYDLQALRAAALRVRAEAGDDQVRH